MKRLLIAAAFATLAASAHAESSDRWFSDGMTWYEHPCGLQAYAKYGSDNRLQVRRDYFLTKRDPSLCSKVFP
jgi:hypothetical protein